jgi:hypothetical protein
MSGIEWRYLPGGSVKHALLDVTNAGSACGIYTLPASDWRGTGSQREYETVESLRPCMRCMRKLGEAQ